MTKIPRRVHAITRKKYVLQKISQHARQRMVHNDSHISSTTNCFDSALSLSLYRQYFYVAVYGTQVHQIRDTIPNLLYR